MTVSRSGWKAMSHFIKIRRLVLKRRIQRGSSRLSKHLSLFIRCLHWPGGCFVGELWTLRTNVLSDLRVLINVKGRLSDLDLSQKKYHRSFASCNKKSWFGNQWFLDLATRKATSSEGPKMCNSSNQNPLHIVRINRSSAVKSIKKENRQVRPRWIRTGNSRIGPFGNQNASSTNL